MNISEPQSLSIFPSNCSFLVVEVTQGTVANLNIKSDKNVIRKGMYKTRPCTSESDKLSWQLSALPQLSPALRSPAWEAQARGNGGLSDGNQMTVLKAGLHACICARGVPAS